MTPTPPMPPMSNIMPQTADLAHAHVHETSKRAVGEGVLEYNKGVEGSGRFCFACQIAVIYGNVRPSTRLRQTIDDSILIRRLVMAKVNECSNCGESFWSNSGSDEICFSCSFLLEKDNETKKKADESVSPISKALGLLKHLPFNRTKSIKPKSKSPAWQPDPKTKLKENARRADLIRRQSKTDSGYVYLMHSANGLYKIGRSKNVGRRNGGLNRQFPIQIKVIHEVFCKDYCKSEKDLHHKYRGKRVENEWFNLSAVDVAWFMSLENGDLDKEF